MDKLTLKRLFAQARRAPGRFSPAGEDGLARALRGDRAAALGEARRGSARASGSAGSRRWSELDAAVELALRHDPRVIVEASAPAARSSARCSATSEAEASPPGEIVAHGDWYDYEAKYTRGRHGAGRAGADLRRAAGAPCGSWPSRSSRSAAAPASPAATSSSSPTARSSSTRSTRCPASPRPASTPSSARPSGIAYPDLCDRLVELAVERHEQRPLLRVLGAGSARSSSTSLISTW